MTSAPIPAATRAAWVPTTPPPITTTFAGATPGTPPSSTPRPPFAFCSVQAPTCGASRPATSDIGASKRQPARGIRHRLIGDAGRARGQQVPRLLRIGGQMQVGEQHLPLAQPLALHRLRLLHLHDQVGLGEHLLRRAARSAPPPPRNPHPGTPRPAPAPVSTITVWPCATASRAAWGVSPTRYSCGLISFGHPIFMGLLPLSSRIAARSLRNRVENHAAARPFARSFLRDAPLSGESSPAMTDLDDTDRRILRVLQKEGRISNAELSETREPLPLRLPPPRRAAGGGGVHRRLRGPREPPQDRPPCHRLRGDHPVGPGRRAPRSLRTRGAPRSPTSSNAT